MRINQNVAALNAWRNLTVNNNSLGKSLERLSSGLRINRAADDAAGLAISEKMRAQIRGLQTAQRNAQDAISLIQTAEGALVEVHAILQRMRDLSVQAASDSVSDDERASLQEEVDELIAEIDRIGSDTEYNKQALFTTASGLTLTFQVGANANQTIEVTIGQMDSETLLGGASGSSVDISSQSGATAAITAVDDAIAQISSQRATLGASQNRLEHTIQNLGVAVENLQAAESRIRDLDMAREMSHFTRNQILLQASTAMLAHANVAPQAVLQLLG